MSSFLEKLSAAYQEKVKKWAEDRERPRYETDIPSALYTAAELGLFYGWGATKAFLLGYIESKDFTGKEKQLNFNMELAVGLCKAAQKIRYREQLESSRFNAAANMGMHDKNYASSTVKLTNAVANEVYKEIKEDK